jgi:hypothetical protein
MWFDDVSYDSWAALWRDYIRCGACSGIRTLTGSCPACGNSLHAGVPTLMRTKHGSERIITETFAGAEGRYEDWIYLIMLQREWQRPLTDQDRFLNIADTKRPSPRAVIVLIFWTYFETRIDRLMSEALRELPIFVRDDLLKRYSSVSARMERLFKIAFSSTYLTDLEDLGFGEIASLLSRVQSARNAFSHGKPEAISDALVNDLIATLKREHEGWIAVFNKRVAHKSSH